MATKVGTGGANNLTGAGGADVLWGRAGDDVLHGLGGNDRLYGEAGDDVLKGGLGNDLLNGGSGAHDRATYFNDGGTRGLNIDLGTGLATRGAEHDTLVGVEDVYGSAYADTIYGNGDAAANSLWGGKGRDWIFAGAGDQADGGDADDVILATDAGRAVLEGGAGTDSIQSFNDVANGGAGADFLKVLPGDQLQASHDFLSGSVGVDAFGADLWFNGLRNVVEILDFSPGERLTDVFPIDEHGSAPVGGTLYLLDRNHDRRLDGADVGIFSDGYGANGLEVTGTGDLVLRYNGADRDEVILRGVAALDLV